MTKEAKKQPKLRFPEFTGDWEQRKLIEVCDYVDYRGKTPTKTEDGIFLVTAKNVKDGFIDYEISKEYISDDAYEEVMRRGKPEVGDVLITTEAPCGNVAQVNNANIALAQRIIKYRGHIGVVDNTYLKYYLLSPKFQKMLNAKSSGGTVQGIKGSILHQQKIKYPSYEEQKKIGQHMDNLDNLIALRQRELGELKELKRGMLQKMFPKKGEKVPEIRFPEFTGDWEQCKLGEVVEFYNGDRSSRYPNDTDMVSDGIPFINAGDLVSGRVKLDTANKITVEKYNELSGAKIQHGDIIYCLRGTLGKNAYVDNFSIGTIASSLVDIRPRKIIGKYLFQVLNSDIEYRQRTINDEGAAQPNLSAKNLSLFDIPMPDEAEQAKIAEYFDNLDRLITLYQQELDGYKKLKKGLLQQMFC